MRYLALCCVLTLTVAGCDAGPDRPSPLPIPSVVVAPPPAPQPVATRVIAVGEEVTGTFTGLSHAFELKAPASGTLVAQLAWAPVTSLLALKLADRRFDPTPPDWSPIVGRMSVASGQSYSVIVEGLGTDEWFDDPFVLKTWME